MAPPPLNHKTQVDDETLEGYELQYTGEAKNCANVAILIFCGLTKTHQHMRPIFLIVGIVTQFAASAFAQDKGQLVSWGSSAISPIPARA